jgi:hypothetical protein
MRQSGSDVAVLMLIVGIERHDERQRLARGVPINGSVMNTDLQ